MFERNESTKRTDMHMLTAEPPSAADSAEETHRNREIRVRQGEDARIALRQLSIDFDRADTDKSGTLTFSEFCSLFGGEFNVAALEQAFKQSDRRENGVCTRAEFAFTAFQVVAIRFQTGIDKVLERFDGDGSGALEFAEFEAFVDDVGFGGCASVLFSAALRLQSGRLLTSTEKIDKDLRSSDKQLRIHDALEILRGQPLLGCLSSLGADDQNAWEAFENRKRVKRALKGVLRGVMSVEGAREKLRTSVNAGTSLSTLFRQFDETGDALIGPDEFAVVLREVSVPGRRSLGAACE